jgi:hypothetical protein
MRKALLFALILGTPFATLAQKVSHTAGGCGPANIDFNVSSPNDGAPPPTPESGKALVYVIQVIENGPNMALDDATTRFGVDGAWVGANHGNSYFYFSVDPGQHDVCVDWQSSLLARSELASAANLDANAGSTYYFQVRTRDATKEYPGYVKIKLVDEAEGRLLLGSSSRVTSRPKK